MQNKNKPLLLRPSGKDYLWGGSRLNLSLIHISEPTRP